MVLDTRHYGPYVPTMKNGGDLKPRKMFEYIRAYHELLVVMAFIVGSVVWTVGYFATKSELKEIQDISQKQVEGSTVFCA